MKKFIVHSQGIMQVEGEYVTPREDVSIMWMPKGEFKFRITAPALLLEKQQNGTLKEPIYCSFAIFDSVEDARAMSEKYIRGTFDFEIRKGRLTSYTEEEVQAKLAEIKTIML